MAKVLLAWELGGNYGHLVALRALARELQRRGHACTFAVRDLGRAQAFLDPRLGPLVQSPVRLTPGRNRVRTQVSYASLLHNIGFNEPMELAGRIQAKAIRVPTVNVSALDITLQVRRDTSAAEINRVLREAATSGPLKGLLNYTELPHASCDCNHDPRSAIVDGS